MEIPKIWRESAVRMQFSAKVEQMTDTHWRYKYPGGQIFFDSIESLVESMFLKNFSEEFVESELVRLFGLSIAAEASISSVEV